MVTVKSEPVSPAVKEVGSRKQWFYVSVMCNYTTRLSSFPPGLPVHAWNDYSERLPGVPGESHG